jgi:hypothetical protein
MSATIPRSKAERERLARNLAAAIDDLYRSDAAPRSRERLLELVYLQVEHAMWVGFLAGKQQQQMEDAGNLLRSSKDDTDGLEKIRARS